MLLQRRRGLFGRKSDLLYSLYNYNYSEESIRTGVNLLKAGLSSTILLDIKLDTTPASGIGSTLKFIYIFNNTINANGLYVGKRAATQNAICLWWMGSSYQASNTNIAGVRFKIVVTHAADSNDVTLKIKKYSGTPVTETLTFSNTFSAAPINTLYFGGTSDANKLSSGTIYKAEVYKRVLTTTEITEFLNA